MPAPITGYDANGNPIYADQITYSPFDPSNPGGAQISQPIKQSPPISPYGYMAGMASTWQTPEQIEAVRQAKMNESSAPKFRLPEGVTQQQWAAQGGYVPSGYVWNPSSDPQYSANGGGFYAPPGTGYIDPTQRQSQSDVDKYYSSQGAAPPGPQGLGYGSLYYGNFRDPANQGGYKPPSGAPSLGSGMNPAVMSGGAPPQYDTSALGQRRFAGGSSTFNEAHPTAKPIPYEEWQKTPPQYSSPGAQGAGTIADQSNPNFGLTPLGGGGGQAPQGNANSLPSLSPQPLPGDPMPGGKPTSAVGREVKRQLRGYNLGGMNAPMRFTS